MSCDDSMKASQIYDSLKFSMSYRVALLTIAGRRLSHLSRLVLPGPFFSFSNSALTFCFWSLAVG